MLADALLEQSDPRGEFIALQCAASRGGASKRERQLLSRHAAEWLGRLAPIVDVESAVFERGFPVFVKYRCGQRAKDRTRDARLLHAALDAPEWSTIRTIDVSGGRIGVLELLASERVQRSVKAIVNVELDHLIALLAAPPATTNGWRRLVVLRRHHLEQAKHLVDTLERCGAMMPELREIEVTFGRPDAGVNEAMNALICSKLARQLDEIVMSYHEAFAILFGGPVTHQSLAAGIGPKRLVMRSQRGSITIDNIEPHAPTILDVQAWGKEGWRLVGEALDEMRTWGPRAFGRGVLVNAIVPTAEITLFDTFARESAEKLGQVRVEEHG